MTKPPDLAAFLGWLASLIEGDSRPEVVAVTVTPGCVTVRFGDGSGCYAKVGHVALASDGSPRAPSWPVPYEPAQTRGAGTPARPQRPGELSGSMRAAYFAGWLQHLLAESGHRSIGAVTTLAQSNAGNGWPPHGLRVDLAAGYTIWLVVVRTSGTAGDDPDLPAEFTPTASSG